MAHGTPDWGFGKTATVHVLTEDLAELAARLGSINVYDRAGHVVWWDDFRKGMGAWRSATDGTGAAVALSTTYPKWPPFCLKLTGGSDSSRFAEVYKYFPPQVEGKIGVEVNVNFLTDWDEFYLEMRVDDATIIHTARIRLSSANDKIYYLDSDEAWQELGTLASLINVFGGYHNLKLVADFSTDLFTRLLLNATPYTVSSYSLLTTADPGAPGFRIWMQLVSRSGENDNCNIDGVIVTQNEP